MVVLGVQKVCVVLDVQVNQACGKGLEYRTHNDVDAVTKCMQDYERHLLCFASGGKSMRVNYLYARTVNRTKGRSCECHILLASLKRHCR